MAEKEVAALAGATRNRQAREELVELENKDWGQACDECSGRGKTVLGAVCLSCNGYGRVGYESSHPSIGVEVTRTITEIEKPVILREPNGRRARDLFSNSTLEDQISWVKGRLADVKDPSLPANKRQAARLNLGHCLQKDRERKLPLNLRLEAQRIVEEPLKQLGGRSG